MRFYVALCLILLAVAAADASIFEWVDSEGVTHFTDNPDKVPEKYRKKVKERESVTVESPPPATATPPAQPPPPAPAAGEDQRLRGGHDEAWWRTRFSAIRQELDGIQSDLPGKREKLSNLHRKRVLFKRSRDRTAYNELNAEIQRDEARTKELEEMLRVLEGDADRAGVPPEWRR